MATQKKQAVRIETESTKLSTLIKSIATRGKKLDQDLHIAACSALFHAYEHKNASFAQSLLEALNKSARKNALKVWLLDFGPFLIKEDGNWGMNAEKQKQGWLLRADAESTPFWQYTTEPEVAPINAMELVSKLIAKLNKAKENGKLDSESATVLERLQKVAPATVTKEATKPETSQA